MLSKSWDEYLLFLLFLFFIYFILLCFLGLHPWHMEVPKLGVESELQLPAYTTATATPNLSHVCHLHYSSGQRQILNSWAKPGIELASSWILVRFVNRWATKGTPSIFSSFFDQLLGFVFFFNSKNSLVPGEGFSSPLLGWIMLCSL